MADYTNRLQVGVSGTLLNQLRDRASYTGVTLPEYVRHILIKEIEDNKIETLSPELEEEVEQAVKDYEAGKLVKYNSVEEMVKSWEKEWEEEDGK